MKSTVKLLYDQQSGFSRWTQTETALKRLRCLKPTDDEQAPIFACQFAQQSANNHYVALAHENGRVSIENTRNHIRHSSNAHHNAIFELAWTNNEMKLITASADHTARLFDVGNGEIRQEKVFFAHNRSVKTVTYQRDSGDVFATGGRDGNIMIWDNRAQTRNSTEQPDSKIINSHNKKDFTPSKSRRRCFTPSSSAAAATVQSVTGLVFQNNETLISCGAGDGLIKVWDLRKSYSIAKKEAVPKVTLPYAGTTSKNGFSSLTLDDAGIRLYANSLDNNIYCYNLSSYNPAPVKVYNGHLNSSFYIKSALSADGNHLISGSSDEFAYIWDLKHSRPRFKLTGHNAEVTCVAWSRDNQNTIITCSDDITHKVWRIGVEALPDAWAAIGGGVAELLPLEVPELASKLAKVKVCEPVTPPKLVMQCQRCKATSSSNYCENCTVNTHSKRKRSCNDDDVSRESKRTSSEFGFGPRRLFGTLNNQMEPLELAKIIEEDCNREQLLKSPTVNLPNFVLDGTAPHLNYSPPKRRSQDWLTKIRIDKSLKMKMEEKSFSEASATPKASKLEMTPRRNSGSRRCVSPRSPLLRFFKVTSSSKCDLQHGCSSKSGMNHVSSPQPSQ